MSENAIVGRLKQIFVYGFGILLLLSGLGGVFEGGVGLFGGLILLVTALLLIPKTRPLITGAVESVGGPDLSTLGRGAFIVIILVGMVAGIALLPAADSSSTDEADSPPSPSDSSNATSEPSPAGSDNTEDSDSGTSPEDSTDSTADPSSNDTTDSSADSSLSSDNSTESTFDFSSNDTTDESVVSNSSRTSVDETDSTSDSSSDNTTDSSTGSDSSSTSDDSTESTSDLSLDDSNSGSHDSIESHQQTSWTVTVVSVTDGDTMDVRMPDGSTETIRLLGVDTPETGSSQTDPSEWQDIPDNAAGREWLEQWGGRADDYAKERLAGQEIYIEADPESNRRGTYGRLLVYVYQSESSEKSFNLRLIENGYARMYDTQFTQRSRFQSAEQEAQNNDVGVWDYSGSSQPSDGSENSPEQATSETPSEESTEALPPLPGDGDYDCSHFDSQDQAQTVLEREAGDPHRLDGDSDGIACESLS